jgi:DNA-directed RNA polymerase I subunit RPA2
MPRRNYPMAILRQSWKQKGPLFTEYGVTIRCVRRDQTASNMTLHYFSDGTCHLMFARNKEQYFVPVVMVLKALVDVSDVKIFLSVMSGEEEDSTMKGAMEGMLTNLLLEGLTDQKTILKYIGERFRLKAELPESVTDEDVAKHILKELVCVHLSKNIDKFNLLVFMIRKLFALVSRKCGPDSADSPMNQEVLLGGHLYLMVLKEKIEGFLRSVRFELEKQAKLSPDKFTGSNANVVTKAMNSMPDVGKQMEYLLATGNLKSRSGLNLQQQSGFTVVADKLNFYRYLSHFRCVHRGAFFSQMRTTSVRKLLPEAWGFLCPVHTPDGAPCGLLNHLAALCQVVTYQADISNLINVLFSLGMMSYDVTVDQKNGCNLVRILLDGQIIGTAKPDTAVAIATQLRLLKAKGLEKVPPTLEIGYVPFVKGGQFPGLFLFTTPARMMRPVRNLITGATELIGSFEQIYMEIAVDTSEIYEGKTTHLELHKGSMLSAIASLTPFSDLNQSPRNMYQCQMGKQTMGTPSLCIPYRMDNKLYRIQTPQSPIVRPYAHDLFGVDEFPLGTNAIVAVISYTGYDMEDAMILSKASVERGFANGNIYKCELIDLMNKGNDRGKPLYQFGVDPKDTSVLEKLDIDGLPRVGVLLAEGDPYYSYIDLTTGGARVQRYKSLEAGYVDKVCLLGGDTGQEVLQRIYIKLRIVRNPIIGDKFASRAGQKGICSQRWPSVDMPFTESGLIPDILFNPHGFPSRMTIGMMVEAMAGKSACLHGICHDATPFTFSEDQPAVKYFAELLVKAGYNYYGNERVYSGVNGQELEADIFVGNIYYQRLRHMVSDKYQVRTTGPIDAVTHQPVKGRKRAGGIRFGEMERDSLIAHGTAFLLQDRLLNCSDRSECHICIKCGSIISPVLEKPVSKDSALSHVKRKWKCKMCDDGGQVELITLPYVFRYLVAELAAMNINMKINVK